MSYEFYHLFHIVAVLCLFTALGALLGRGRQNKSSMVLHGVATLVLFVTGFGLIHRLGVEMNSLWIMGKIALWGVLSVLIPVWASRNIFKKYLLALTLFSGFCAIWLVVYKI